MRPLDVLQECRRHIAGECRMRPTDEGLGDLLVDLDKVIQGLKEHGLLVEHLDQANALLQRHEAFLMPGWLREAIAREIEWMFMRATTDRADVRHIYRLIGLEGDRRTLTDAEDVLAKLAGDNGADVDEFNRLRYQSPLTGDDAWACCANLGCDPLVMRRILLHLRASRKFLELGETPAYMGPDSVRYAAPEAP